MLTLPLRNVLFHCIIASQLRRSEGSLNRQFHLRFFMRQYHLHISAHEQITIVMKTFTNVPWNQRRFISQLKPLHGLHRPELRGQGQQRKVHQLFQDQDLAKVSGIHQLFYRRWDRQRINTSNEFNSAIMNEPILYFVKYVQDLALWKIFIYFLRINFVFGKILKLLY